LGEQQCIGRRAVGGAAMLSVTMTSQLGLPLAAW
jgi:hypothetical protein